MSEHAAPVQAVQAPAPQLPANGFQLQRKCACGSYGGGGECDKCREDKTKLQRAAAGAGKPNGLPPLVYDVLRSSGEPLDARMRGWMEPRFNHDFSGVRVHTDARAAQSAREVHALAYTVGQDVVFGAGQYAPGTERGGRLLAHELTHVVQQTTSGGSAQAKAVSDPSDAAEIEADAIADRVVSGERATVMQAPSATLHADRGDTEKVPAGVFGAFAAGVVGVSIAAIAGAFDREKFSDDELVAYLTVLATTRKIEDHTDSDNKARNVVSRWNAPQKFDVDKGFSSGKDALTANELKRLLILELLSGPTLETDEQAIITIFKKSNPEDIKVLLNPQLGLSLQDIESDLSEENLSTLMSVLNQKLPDIGKPQVKHSETAQMGECSVGRAIKISFAHQQAQVIVAHTIQLVDEFISKPEGNKTVKQQLDCFFSNPTPDQIKTVRSNLQAMGATLPNITYICPADPFKEFKVGGKVYKEEKDLFMRAAVDLGKEGQGRTFQNMVFPPFFELDPREQTRACVHESLHHALMQDDEADKKYNPKCGEVDTATALVNADNYAMFAMALESVSSAPAGPQTQQVQRKASDDEAPEEVPPVVEEALRSPGQPLDSSTRAFMEPRFGHDFGDVRIHTDSAAAQSARAVNAHAYTVGDDVVFGAGRYAPRTQTGAALLAHELTHVTQQSRNGGTAAQSAKGVSHPHDAAEVEADTAAARVLSGDTVHVAQPPSATIHTGLAPSEVAGLIVGGVVLVGGALTVAALLGAFESSDRIVDCDKEKGKPWADQILAAEKTAQQWVNNAVDKLNEILSGSKKVEEWVDEKLREHFKINATAKKNVSEIRDTFVAIQSKFSAAKYQCDKDCPESEATFKAGEVKSVLPFSPKIFYGRIHLCSQLLDKKDDALIAETIVHEMAHRFAGKTGEVYRKAKTEVVGETSYRTMTPDQALENADSYAQFARTLFNVGSMKAESAKETATEGGEVKRKAIDSEEPAEVPSIVDDVVGSSGQPLDSTTRALMEPRFNRDFGNVRVHTDSTAAKSAREVNALAYTVGQDVVFGAGQYEPGTEEGTRLLAHELTHVVQQSDSGPSTTQTARAISEPDDAAEVEADDVASSVMNGDRSVAVKQSPNAAVHTEPARGPKSKLSRRKLQRQPKPETESAPATEPAPATETAPVTEPTTEPAPPLTVQTGGIPQLDPTSGMKGYPQAECPEFLWAREYPRIFRLDTISVVGLSAKPASEKTEDVRSAKRENEAFQVALGEACSGYETVQHPFRVRFYYVDVDFRTTTREKVTTEDAKKNRELGETLGASQANRVLIYVERDRVSEEDFSDVKTLQAKLKEVIDKAGQSGAKKGAKTGAIVGGILGSLTAIGVGIGVGLAVGGGGAALGTAIAAGIGAGLGAGAVVLGLSAGLGALFGHVGGTDRGTEELGEDRKKQVVAFVELLRKTGEVKGDQLTSSDSDNLARDAVTLWIDDPSTLPLTVKDRRLLIRVMLEGPTLDDDERAIIKLLENSTDAEILEILDTTADKKERVTFQDLDDNIHGAEWRETKEMLTARFPQLGAPKIEREGEAGAGTCDAPQTVQAVAAIKQATILLQNASQRLKDFAADPKAVENVDEHVQCYFTGATASDITSIAGVYDTILSLYSSRKFACLGNLPVEIPLEEGTKTEYECNIIPETAISMVYHDEKTGKMRADVTTYFCPKFFEQGPHEQALTVIHEWVHQALKTRTDLYQPGCKDLKLATALTNPDSFAFLTSALWQGTPLTAARGIPTVKIGNFRNSGSPTPENRCAICPQIPGLGPDPRRGLNFMELRGDISGDVPGALYDFKRTKEAAVWGLTTSDSWIRGSAYDPPGTPDDAFWTDEDVAPKFNRIYSIDGPGPDVPLPSMGDPNIKLGFYKGNFVESVNVKVGDGPWTPSSNLFEWHSVTWFERADDGLLRRTPGKNEVEPGHIPIGPAPPGP